MPLRAAITLVRAIEARFDNVALRPTVRQGERVGLIVVRKPDASRWDFDKLTRAAGEQDLALAEQGLAEWVDDLEASERS